MSEKTPYKARVDDIVRIGDDKAVLRLKFEENFSYQAGQFVLLSFADLEARPYSIANAPGADSIEIHIKDNGRGGLSSYAVKSLTCGEIVNVFGPYGECVYQKTDLNIVLIAGGMGIAPMKAIAEEAVRQNHGARIHLYWGTRTIEDVYIDTELRELENIHASFVYSHVVGKTVGEHVAHNERDLRDTEIYLAGPFEMIAAVVPQIVNNGAQLSRIHTDQRDAFINIKP